ncbi:MAG: adenosylcobinamide-GDP ribazoletransferase [Bacillota bacterium]
MKRFILLLQFLTRIPININLDVTRKDLQKSVIYFPLVGGVIGGLIFLLTYLPLDLMLLSFFIVLFEIIITGGLHLDGLCDTFDGIFSNRKKEEIIEIMKDPNVGTFGALSLILLIIFKIILIYLINSNYIFLIIMPVISRFCVVFASKISNYAKEKGLGNLFIEQVNIKQLLISLSFTSVIILLDYKYFFIFLINIIFTYYFVKVISNKISGITGDTLGAIVELNEVIFLFSIYILGGIL